MAKGEKLNEVFGGVARQMVKAVQTPPGLFREAYQQEMERVKWHEFLHCLDIKLAPW